MFEPRAMNLAAGYVPAGAAVPPESLPPMPACGPSALPVALGAVGEAGWANDQAFSILLFPGYRRSSP